MYWGKVKGDAEECVKRILKEGDTPSSLMDAIGKEYLEKPEDWDDLRDFCEDHGAMCHDIHRLERALVMWIQAFNELEYKKLYP